MKNYKYNVSLRSGLSLNAKVLKVLKEGFKDLDSAKDFALKYAADPSNEEDLGCKSYYCRILYQGKEDAIGIDYGSHTKFILIMPVEA